MNWRSIRRTKNRPRARNRRRARSRRRTPNPRRSALLLAPVAALAAAAGACSDDGAPDGPADAIRQARTAFENRDLEAFERHVAIERTLEATMDSVFALMEEQGLAEAKTSEDSMGVQMALALGGAMKTMVVTLGAQTVRESVREGRPVLPEAARSQIEQLPNADSLDYDEEAIEELDLEVGDLETVYAESGTSRVRMEITGTNLDSGERESWPLEFVVEEADDGAWQVVGVANVREIAELAERRAEEEKRVAEVGS